MGVLVSAVLPILVWALSPILAAAKAVAARWAHTPCPGAELRPGPSNMAAASAATLCLINQLRSSYHLQALRANRYLQRVASGQVRHMVHWNYFSDLPPLGLSPGAQIAASRYAGRAARLSTGQNIGWGTGEDATPANMVAAWMASPPHRALILARGFRDAGVGVLPSLPAVLNQARPGALYAVEFAARAA